MGMTKGRLQGPQWGAGEATGASRGMGPCWCRGKGRVTAPRELAGRFQGVVQISWGLGCRSPALWERHRGLAGAVYQGLLQAFQALRLGMWSDHSCPPPTLSSSLTPSPCLSQLPQAPGGVLQHTLCPSAWDTLPHVAGSLVGSLHTASVPLSLHPRELCMWNIVHPAPYFLHSAHHHLTHGTFISELVCLLQHNVHPMMARTMLLPVSSESSQMSSTWAWSCSTKTVWMSEWVSQLPNPICW